VVLSYILDEKIIIAIKPQESGPEVDFVEVQDQEGYDDLDDDPDDERGDEIQPW